MKVLEWFANRTSLNKIMNFRLHLCELKYHIKI
jgi:hypothetical protein